MTPRFSPPVAIALDTADRDRLLSWARAVAPHVAVLKLGLTAFAAWGPALVAELSGLRPVFLDLKLHDIPAQVEGAAAAAAASGAELLTVHASGGPDMVAAAVAGAGAARVLAVTVLTSLDAAALGRIGLAGSPAQAAERLAALALEAGAAGLVCSAREAAALRARFGPGPLLAVPGVRPAGAPPGDQARTATPAQALAAGADLLVVGRPVTAAADPAGAAAALLAGVA